MAGEEKKNKKTSPEGKKFVMNGARIKCDLCSKPEGKLRVTSNALKLQDMLWANINDTNGAQNLIFNGVCNHSKYGDKKPPCKSVIQLKGWDKPASITVQDAPGIVMESQNYCIPHSNQKIMITDSGQTATESEIEESDEHRITSVEGSSLVLFNSSGEYKVTGYNVDESEVDKTTIKWAFRFDGKTWHLKSTGDSLRLKFNVEEHISKVIDVVPYIENLNGSVSVQTEIVGFPIFIDKYKLKGKQYENGTFTIADDMCYGDGVNLNTGHSIYSIDEIRGLSPLFAIQLRSSEETLWNVFEDMVTTFFSMGELEGVALKMIEHFKSNDGGEFTDLILTRHVMEHVSTQRFCNSMEDLIINRLKAYREDTGKVQHKFNNLDENGEDRGDEPRLEDRDYGHPRFNTWGDTFGGLTICMNDTWAFEVMLTEFEEKQRTFKATYKVILYDHFGLNKPDLEKIYRLGAGFRAWFVLQHVRNYKPFITKVDFEKTFEGEY